MNAKPSELKCTFCGKSMKSRGGLSNHMGKSHPEEYIVQLQVELEFMERRLQAFSDRQPEPPREEEKRGPMVGGQPITLAISFETPFSMSVENSIENLERIREQKSWLETQKSRFSAPMFTHLMMLAENDVVEMARIITSKREFDHDKENETYYFDLSTKNFLISRYEDVIRQWKEKIATRKQEGAALEKTGGLYKCEMCDAAFKSKGAVTSHVNKTHLDAALERIEAEEAKEIADAGDVPFAKYMTTRKKMLLFLSRNEIDDALKWLKVMLRKMSEMDDEPNQSTKSYILGSFAKPFKGMISEDVKEKIDKIFKQYHDFKEPDNDPVQAGFFS